MRRLIKSANSFYARIAYLALFLTINPAVAGSGEDRSRVPLLSEVKYIYVLDSMEIPDGYQNFGDQDGLRDRPRIMVWDATKHPHTDHGLATQYRYALQAILDMMSDSYVTKSKEQWHLNHLIGNGYDGVIVRQDGSQIGWHHKPGGLGYFELNYDPDSEKVSVLKLKIEQENHTSHRIYRQKRCN